MRTTNAAKILPWPKSGVGMIKCTKLFVSDKTDEQAEQG